MASRSSTPHERRVQSTIIKHLNARNGTLVRCRSADSGGHVVGDPDITGSIGGQHVEIEVKVGKGCPEEIQWYRLRQWAGQAESACAVVYNAEQATAFEQEVLAWGCQGHVLVFGAALEQVRQGKHGGGPEVTFATISGGGGYEEVLEPGEDR